jgi:hypothetical protein
MYYKSLRVYYKLTVFALVIGLFVLFAVLSGYSVHAAPGINQQINFQGRLYTDEGAIAPDGYYNMEFKIYQDGDGQSVGTTGTPSGTPEWTESHLNNNSTGVQVKNGFMSVELGSVTAFGSSIDWNQSVLWLSINIGNTNSSCTPFTSCSPDGEMLPMKRLSSVPYSLNSGLLGGLSSAQFLQLAQGVQTDASTNTNSIYVNKTGTGNIINLQANGTDAFTVSNVGDLAFGNNANHTISVTTAAADTAGKSLTISAGGAGTGASALAGGDLLIQGGAGGGTDGNGGSVAIDAGAKSGNGTDGTLSLGVSHASTIQIGSTALANTQTVNIGSNNTAGSTTNVTIGAGSSASSGTTTVRSKGDMTISSSSGNVGVTASAGTMTISSSGNSSLTSTAGAISLSSSGNTALSTNGVTRATLDTANTLYLGNGLTAAAPNNFTISGTGSTTTAVTGGNITLQGGNATVGSANGGSLVLSGGAGVGTGAQGLVVLTTPTFSTTANDANCYTGGALVASSCTFAAASVNNSSAILVGFSNTSQTATLPDPSYGTASAAGRVIYITAANGTKDFTLSVNGGGVGNTIAMRQNTTATMIWNGGDWTAAGASSSTTLQSAYDNTLTTAGGAELILSNNSNANGLTIRDNPTDPINGALFEVQTSTAGQLFSINNNTTEYAEDGGAETGGGTSDASDSTFPASTWSAASAGGTVTRTTTTINPNAQISTGMASVSVVTAGTANQGAVNRLSSTLTQNMNYNVSFAAKLLSTSNAFQDLTVYYSVNGTALTTACTNYSTQTVQVSTWSKINCTFTVPSGATSTNSIIIVQNSAVAHTFFIDNLSVSLSANVNYATDGSVNDSVNFSTNWSAIGSGASASYDSSVGNDTNNSARVTGVSAAGSGIRNALSIIPFSNGTLYRVTAYAYISAGTTPFNDFTVRYTPNAGSNFIDCKDYNTQTVSSSPGTFTKITCYITTDNTSVTTPYIYFVQNGTAASARTFNVDTFSMNLASNTVPNIQIGGGQAGSPLTLFTLDRGASAPIAANNDALLGSMYYDTTLGKLQCYEADGWGACGSSPDSVVTISPEYTNAVLHGTGVGTMTSDLCSDTLNINDGSSSQPTICGTNETYNFYKWTSPQASAQTYSIYVTYQLPSTFNAFASGQTSLMGRTDNGPSSGTGTVQYSIYRNSSSSALTQCGSTITVSTGTSSAWSSGTTTGANGASDPSACGFSAGDSIVFKIDMIANQNANAYVGNLNFIFTNK